MIGISTLTQDATNGAIVIEEKEKSKIYNATARVTRTKTLDGGVVIDHQGFVAGDRQIDIDCSLSEADESVLREIFENQTIVGIATKHGFYSGVIESLIGDGGEVQIKILLKAVA